MSKEYTREQLRQLYLKLPEEIKEAASADETAEQIEEICARNSIDDERVGVISDLIRNVLFGVLPPDDFREALEKELKIKKDVAKKVAQEINRFIFYPVKPALDQLYKIEVKQEVKATEKTAREIKITKEEPTTPPAREDKYKEPIE